MTIVFSRPESMLDVPTHYCPGCYDESPTAWWQKCWMNWPLTR